LALGGLAWFASVICIHGTGRADGTATALRSERDQAMNFRTTLVLLILVAAGGLIWIAPTLYHGIAPAPSRPPIEESVTLQFLQNDLTPDKIQRIRIRRGSKEIDITKAKNGDWVLPGSWPARNKEVEELVQLLSGLRSRFASTVLDNAGDLKTYGLDKPPVTVVIDCGSGEHSLAFAEESGETNHFSRPTYARLDDQMEIVPLAPGLITALDRPADYYQQRRLFPSERVVKETDSPEKVERLTAKSLSAKDGKGSYTLEKADDDWELRGPVHDHVD